MRKLLGTVCTVCMMGLVALACAVPGRCDVTVSVPTVVMTSDGVSHPGANIGAGPGAQFSLPLALGDTSQVAGFQADLTYNANDLTLVPDAVSDTTIIALTSPTWVKSTAVVDSSNPAQTVTRILSWNSGAVAGNIPPRVLAVKFIYRKDAPATDLLQVTVSNVILSDGSGSSINPVSASGTSLAGTGSFTANIPQPGHSVTAEPFPFVFGDVANSLGQPVPDGKLTASDVVMAFKIFGFTQIPSPRQLAAMDVRPLVKSGVPVGDGVSTRLFGDDRITSSDFLWVFRKFSFDPSCQDPSNVNCPIQ